MGLFLTDVGTLELETEQLLAKNRMHHSNCWLLHVESTIANITQFSLQMLDHWWSNPTTKQQQQTKPFAGHVG